MSWCARISSFAAILFATLHAAEDFVTLPTELKISSVSVSIRAPLGWQYRPGVAFPLELHIDNPGPPMEVELTAAEGSAGENGEWAERAILPVKAALSGTSRFLLPIRAPAVSASVTIVLRGTANGGGQAELFRASLARVMRPLPSSGRNVLVCGNGFAPRGPQIQSSRVAPLDLPAESWMWEGVDWVVLKDAAIKEARPESREALRRWLLGGGRLFLGSPVALAAAVSARLLPIETPGDISANWNWWERNVGLKSEDVLASKNFHPVYARLHLGFGQVVFLFPGSDANDADDATVFNRPDIQRHRAELPDARVQPERFGAFAQAVPSGARRVSAMRWALLGALILCALLGWAHTSRTKLEVPLLALAAGALLTALVAYGFPQQELTISRVTFERCPADGACVARDEWALLEAFRGPVERSARGPAHGTLAPRFGDLDDLRAARLDRWSEDGRLALGRIATEPNRPALIYAAQAEPIAIQKAAAETVLNVPEVAAKPRVATETLDGADMRRAIWIRADGSTTLLKKSAASDTFESEAYSARTLETALTQEADAAFAKAWSTALNRAVEDAARQGGAALIVWSHASHFNQPLISVEGASNGAGNDLLIRTIFLK